MIDNIATNIPNKPMAHFMTDWKSTRHQGNTLDVMDSKVYEGQDKTMPVTMAAVIATTSEVMHEKLASYDECKCLTGVCNAVHWTCSITRIHSWENYRMSYLIH